MSQSTVISPKTTRKYAPDHLVPQASPRHTPAASRHAVQDAARRTLVDPDDVEALILATSEAVTNAMVHGQRPVTVRAWTAMERMVVTVHDQGNGPHDPYVGLVPRPSSLDGGGGFGLWLAHQMLPVAYSRDIGFTVRLTAGAPLPQ